MKKIKLLFAAILAASLVGFTACSISSSSTGSSNSDDASDIDPFAGTCWYGDLYKPSYENGNTVYVTDGTGVLLNFKPESEKTNIMGKEYGYVEFPNPIYFLFPKNYEANKKAGDENVCKVLENQKFTYSVEKNADGYSACIGIMGEMFRLTICNENADNGTLKWTSGGSVYSYKNNETITWYCKDTLPRTIYKQKQ